MVICFPLPYPAIGRLTTKIHPILPSTSLRNLHATPTRTLKLRLRAVGVFINCFRRLRLPSRPVAHKDSRLEERMSGLSCRGSFRSASRLTHFRIFYKTGARPGVQHSSFPTTTTYLRGFHFSSNSCFSSSFKMSEAERKWPAKLVREKFFNFFAGKEHTIGVWMILSYLFCLYFFPKFSSVLLTLWALLCALIYLNLSFS
jgi:hypothetical protein